MNQTPNAPGTTQFPLHVSPRFLPCCDGAAKEAGISDLRCRIILDPIRGLTPVETPEFDPQKDLLLKSERVTMWTDREQAFRLQGWILETVCTISEPEKLRLSPPKNMSTASHPGRLPLDRRLFCLVQPELAGWSGWLWRIRDRMTKSNLFEGSFECIADQISRGDSRGAVVVETKPHLLITAYSDEFDCVVGLKFPAAVGRFHKLKPGDRLITCNRYEIDEGSICEDLTIGPHALMHQPFTNFRPVIARFVSSDHPRLDTLEAGITSIEWTRIDAATQDWLDRFRAGQVKPRIGAPLWANAAPGKPPVIDVPVLERAVAATIDLILVTIVVAAVWWVWLGFDEIFLKYMENPRQQAARAVFRQTAQKIRFAASGVFLIYCAIMQASVIQATFGKLLLRMRVIDKETGGRISLLTSLRRTFMLLLGVIPAFGALVQSKERETLHDKSTKTRVVRIVSSR